MVNAFKCYHGAKLQNLKPDSRLQLSASLSHFNSLQSLRNLIAYKKALFNEKSLIRYKQSRMSNESC